MAYALKRSSEYPALTLTGQAGSLIAILDVLLPANGWVKVYTATNQAVYRPGKGKRHYLYIDDTSTTTAGIASFESMTSISAGVNRMPNARQAAALPVLRKSSTADATVRPWQIVVGETFVYVTTSISTTSWPDQPTVNVGGFGWGDLVEALPGDQYPVFLFANDGVEQLGRIDASLAAGVAVPGGHWVARGAAGLPTPAKVWAVAVGAPAAATATGRWLNGHLTADPFSRQVDLGRVHVYEAVGGNRRYVRRGRLPAVWAPGFDTSAGQALDVSWPGGPVLHNYRLIPVAAGAVQGALALQET